MNLRSWSRWRRIRKAHAGRFWSRKKQIACIAMLTTVMSTGVVLPYQFAPPGEHQRLVRHGNASRIALPQTIEILVWNIAKGSSAEFADDFSQAADGKDLVLIQEYHDNPTVNGSIQCDGHALEVGSSFCFRYDNSITGVATRAIAASLRSDSQITEHWEPFICTPKATLLTEYAVEGTDETLLVVNLHGINIAGFDALRDQLLEIKPTVESHPGPILFAGDFNTNTKEKLSFVRQYMTDLGLQETEFENDQRMVVPFGTLRLDYVFTRGLKVDSSAVLGELNGSDHKPIVLRATIASEPQPPSEIQPTPAIRGE